MRVSLFLVTFASVLSMGLSQTSHECTVERLGSDGEEYCIFRDVTYQPRVGASFGYPSGSAKPVRIAFQRSTMDHLPREFLQQFDADLKALNVEGCQLKSVTVTSGLEALYARNNSIERVHQSGPTSVLRVLDLSQNKIKDVRNITRFQNLVTLDLSWNTGILTPTEEVLEISDFAELNKLQELNLSHLDANYLDNTKGTGFESLLLLDLSYNNLIPSDLDLRKLHPLSKLETLRLNDNHMASIDYNYLVQMKSLKTVFLNGNDFRCNKIKEMIEHLNTNNVETPTEKENYNCQSQQNKFQDMCCVGFTPAPPPPPPTMPDPKPTPTGRTPAPFVPTPRDETDPSPVDEPEKDGGNGALPWIIVGVVAALLAVGAVVGFLVYRKKQSASRDMNAENALPLRNN